MKMKYLLLLPLLLLSSLVTFSQSTPCPTGKTCSGSVTFTVSFPAPGTPASVAPSSVVAGAAATIVTLTAATGSTFNNTMVVEACQATPAVCSAATDLATTFVDSTHLTAVIPNTMLASSGTISIYLSQPSSAHAANLQYAPIPANATTPGYFAYRGGAPGGPTRS